MLVFMPTPQPESQEEILAAALQPKTNPVEDDAPCPGPVVRRLPGSIAQFAPPLSCPLLRSLNIPEAARGSPTIVFTLLQRRPRTNKSAAESFVWAALQFSLDDCYSGPQTVVYSG